MQQAGMVEMLVKVKRLNLHWGGLGIVERVEDEQASVGSLDIT